MKSGESTRCPKCNKLVHLMKQGNGALYCNNCHYMVADKEE